MKVLLIDSYNEKILHEMSPQGFLPRAGDCVDIGEGVVYMVNGRLYQMETDRLIITAVKREQGQG